MKLKLLGDKPATEPEVFVSLSAPDKSAVNILLHIDHAKITIGWISHRGVISMSRLGDHEQKILKGVGFEIERRMLSVQN